MENVDEHLQVTVAIFLTCFCSSVLSIKNFVFLFCAALRKPAFPASNMLQVEITESHCLRGWSWHPWGSVFLVEKWGWTPVGWEEGGGGKLKVLLELKGQKTPNTSNPLVVANAKHNCTHRHEWDFLSPSQKYRWVLFNPNKCTI